MISTSTMAAYYEVYGSWDDMRIARGRLPVAPLSPGTPPDMPSEPPVFPIRFILIDPSGQAIIPGKDYAPGQTVSDAAMKDAEPVIVNGETVGYIIADREWLDRSTLEKTYLERINQLLLVAMGGATAVALLLSFARTLSRPYARSRRRSRPSPTNCARPSRWWLATSLH